MTKIKIRWFRILSFFLPTEKNITKNKAEILNLLTHSEFKPLSVQESIELWRSVEQSFKAELTKRRKEAKQDVAIINIFMPENISVVADTVFSLPIHNIEFDKVATANG